METVKMHVYIQLFIGMNRGVSGSDKTNETESPNQKNIRPYLVRFETDPNQSYPIYLGLVHGFTFRDP